MRNSHAVSRCRQQDCLPTEAQCRFVLKMCRTTTLRCVPQPLCRLCTSCISCHKCSHGWRESIQNAPTHTQNNLLTSTTAKQQRQEGVGLQQATPVHHSHTPEKQQSPTKHAHQIRGASSQVCTPSAPACRGLLLQSLFQRPLQCNIFLKPDCGAESTSCPHAHNNNNSPCAL